MFLAFEVLISQNKPNNFGSFAVILTNLERNTGQKGSVHKIDPLD